MDPSFWGKSLLNIIRGKRIQDFLDMYKQMRKKGTTKTWRLNSKKLEDD